MTARDAAYWRNAYELLVAQTGRDVNDGLGPDPRRRSWRPPLTVERDRRIDELLEANNRYLERARAAEAALRERS